MKPLNIILSLFVLLITAAIAVVVFQLIETQISSNSGHESTSTAVYVGRDEVVLGIASFLQESYNNEEGFVLRYRCENESCSPTPINPNIYFDYPILGLLSAYEITGNISYKTTADLAMNRVLKKCDEDLLACQNNFFALAAYYRLTNDDVYLEAMQRSSGLVNMSIINDSQQLITLAFGETFKKLLILHNLLGTDNSIYKDYVVNAANIVLPNWPDNTGYSIYEENGYPIKHHMPYVVKDLFLSAYQLTNDEKYLEVVLEFYSKANIYGNLDKFDWEGGVAALLHSANGMIELNEILPDNPEYIRLETEAVAITTDVINSLYDNSGRIIFDGRGNLVTGVFDPEETIGVNYKNTLINGLALHMLMSEEFENVVYTLDN